MKFTLHILILNLLLFSCKSKEIDKNATIEILDDFSELQTIIDSQGDDLLILNFWSIHCPPCIKEMTHFNKLELENQNKKIKILLISLDDVTKLNAKIYPFVKKHGIVPEVMMLKDQNYSKWTEKIDESWYGALPATLIINGEKRNFRFGSYETYEELQHDIDSLLSN